VRSQGRCGLAGPKGYLDGQRFFQLPPVELPSLRNLLGETLARSGQLDGARGHLEAAARIDPRIPRVYNTLGEVYVKLGLQPAAAAAFRKSLALQPGQAEVRQRLSAVSP